MIKVKGVYKDGKVYLQKKVEADKPIDVIVTFMEDIKTHISEKLDLNNFSFIKSRKLLENYKGSLGDTVIEERRSAV